MFARFDLDNDGVLEYVEFEQALRVLVAEAKSIRGIVSSWDGHDGVRSMAEAGFRSADLDGDGQLQWNNGEIRELVHNVFSRANVEPPAWPDHVWYHMFRVADVDGSLALDMDEAVRFVRHCFEAALGNLLELPQVAKSIGVHSLSPAELFARGYVSQPVSRAMVMQYGGGVSVDLREMMHHLSPLINTNVKHRARMIQIIESGEHVRASAQIQAYCDKDRNGTLTWNNGEIRMFIQSIFRHYGLVPPAEAEMYHIYNKFDRDRSYSLDARECLEMVDALLRAVFAPEASGPQIARTMSPGAQPQRLHSGPIPGGSGYMMVPVAVTEGIATNSHTGSPRNPSPRGTQYVQAANTMVSHPSTTTIQYQRTASPTEQYVAYRTM